MKRKGVFVSILLITLLCFTFTGCFTFSLLFGGDKTDDKITVDSGVMQNVVKITGDGLKKGELKVSPDGKSLIYSQYKEKSSVSELILLKDVLLPAKTPLGVRDSNSVAWYDNGKTFIYSGLDGYAYKLIKSSIDGGGKTYITRNSIGNGDRQPSIKNNKILCMSTISGVSQIVCLNDDGTEVTLLTEGESPCWHPTENKFLFVKNSNSICEMNLTNNQITELYSDIGSRFFTPLYSPNGKYIVFTQFGFVNLSADGGKKRRTEYRHHLFLMNCDGSNRTQLTTGNVNVWSPSWGGNNELFFLSDVGGKEEIWKAKVRITN